MRGERAELWATATAAGSWRARACAESRVQLRRYSDYHDRRAFESLLCPPSESLSPKACFARLLALNAVIILAMAGPRTGCDFPSSGIGVHRIGRGERRPRASCTNPRPANGGNYCGGSSTQEVACNRFACAASDIRAVHIELEVVVDKSFTDYHGSSHLSHAMAVLNMAYAQYKYGTPSAGSTARTRPQTCPRC